MKTGITVVWMADPHTYAESVQDAVWAELASRPEWQAWLGEHIFGAERISIVFYEDRLDDRIVVRGDTLRYVVPIDDVRRGVREALPARLHGPPVPRGVRRVGAQARPARAAGGRRPRSTESR